MNIETLTEQKPTNPDATGKGSIEQEPTNLDSTGEGSIEQEPTNLDSTGEGSTEQEPTNLDSTGEGSIEQIPAGEDMNDYLTEYNPPRRGDICTGVVIETNERGLVVDVSLKREGFVPAEDLELLDEEKRSEIQPGATVSVLVVQPEDREGHPILSIHQAHLHQDWLLAEEMMKKGELYEGEVSGYNRGGLVVQFGKIRGFIPASQVVGLPRRLPEEDRQRRLAGIVGQQFGLKVIEVDRRRRRLIFSQRRALRAWQELERERVMDQLTEGETCHGRVTDITSFGAFVDLGGADGLIHVSELSWSRVDNPHQVLKVGDEVDVYVLNLDRARKRIALSLKKLQPDPWTLVDDHYRTEQLVEGRVTRVLDFGAFVELDLGVEGLLHASEMIGAPEFRPSDIVHPGETLLVKIIRIDSRRKRIALSARQVRQDEWERWVAKQQEARKAEEAAIREEAEAAAEAAAAAEAEAEAKIEVEIEVSETGEEETAAPETETGEAGEEEAAAPETETGEADEEEAAAPETETGEADEEEAAAPETETGEAGEEEAAAPEAETGEAGEEEAAAPEAETGEAGEEETAAPETETGEAGEEEATAPETETGEAGEEEAAAPETEIDETGEEETAVPEAEAIIQRSD